MPRKKKKAEAKEPQAEVENEPVLDEEAQLPEEEQDIPELQEAELPEEDLQEEEPVVEARAERPPTMVTMELQVMKLREAMELLKPAVPKKPTLPVLSFVLLKNGQAMACDLERAVVVDLPGFQGQCLIPFHSVLDLVKYIPGHEMLTIEQSGKDLSLSWSKGKASYQTHDPLDFPPLTEPEARVRAVVDGDTLVPALLSMVQYCATNKDRPVLSGVSVFLGDSIEVAGADGYRMAYKVLPIAIPPADDLKTVTIPTETVRLLAHLWTRAPRSPQGNTLVELVASRGKISLAFGDNRLVARFGAVFVGSQLIGGTPPNFRQLIPGEPTQQVRIYAPDLERAVRRVREVAEAGSGIVRLVWGDGTMTLSARAEDKGEVQATIPAEVQGDPGRTALNVHYLMEYLKDKTSLVTMGVSEPQSPVLFHHGGAPLVLIMPMHVQW